jgi:hypothetical protein
MLTYETIITLKIYADNYNKNKHMTISNVMLTLIFNKRKGEEINERENPFSTQGT